MARVLLSKHPISNLCSLFGVDAKEFALKVVKPLGEDARDVCTVLAPLVMRISIHVITFSKNHVLQSKSQ